MLSLAGAFTTAFAAPSTLRAAAVRSTVKMEVPPVFSVVEDTAVPEPEQPFSPSAYVQTLPGISGPLGFFDPAGFCSDDNGADGAATEGKVRFYREVELKHCRVAMLAALGFPLAEQV